MVKEDLIKNKDDIVKLYSNGLTQKQIAEIYDTSKSSIARLLQSIGITSKIVVTNFDEQQMVTLYQDGITIRDIAKMFNVGERRVSNILKKHNIQILLSCVRPS